MPRFTRWSPDTCTCEHLYVCQDDDGSTRMIGYEEARQIHQQRYDQWVQALATHGLVPADVANRTAAWTAARTHFKRRKRLFDEEIPIELLSSVLDPSVVQQVEYEICPDHLDMGYPIDEEPDSADAPMRRSSVALRGQVLAENQAKNWALAQIAIEAGVHDDPEQERALLERVKWVYTPGDRKSDDRQLHIELPPDLKSKAAAVAARLAAEVPLPVNLADSIEEARAAGAVLREQRRAAR